MICDVTGNDSLVVGLTTVDNNWVESVMTRQRFPDRLADGKSSCS
jgi:hypothetical protein